MRKRVKREKFRKNIKLERKEESELNGKKDRKRGKWKIGKEAKKSRNMVIRIQVYMYVCVL